MNTTHAATRQPSTNPFDLVHVDAMADRRNLPGDAGLTCQAITAKRTACTRTATVWAYGQGPTKMAPAHLCSTHGWSRYLIDADPSL